VLVSTFSPDTFSIARIISFCVRISLYANTYLLSVLSSFRILAVNFPISCLSINAIFLSPSPKIWLNGTKIALFPRPEGTEGIESWYHHPRSMIVYGIRSFFISLMTISFYNLGHFFGLAGCLGRGQLTLSRNR
jgi:hypothetical protein